VVGSPLLLRLKLSHDATRLRLRRHPREVIPPPPAAAGAQWIAGYWELRGAAWLWVDGRWQVPGQAGQPVPPLLLDTDDDRRRADEARARRARRLAARRSENG
jgi:hypothetical protein